MNNTESTQEDEIYSGPIKALLSHWAKHGPNGFLMEELQFIIDNELPMNMKAIVEKHYVWGLTLPELAHCYGTSLQSINSSLYHAHRLITYRLENLIKDSSVL